MAVTTQVADARDILGVTPDMTQQFGDQATVAVLDTDVDLTHSALARIASDDCRNFTNADDMDEEGHGTHVASIAGGDDGASGGRYSGVAPLCRFVAAKVISGTGYGDLESVLRGMAWAVFEKNADVLSLSIGDDMTPPNGRSIWTRACDEAYRQGTIVCVAGRQSRSLVSREHRRTRRREDGRHGGRHRQGAAARAVLGDGQRSPGFAVVRQASKSSSDTAGPSRRRKDSGHGGIAPKSGTAVGASAARRLAGGTDVG